MPGSAPSDTRPAAYLALLFASGLAVLVAAGALSYRYDPGEQFHKPGSRAAARALLEGRALAYRKNLDLRLVLRRVAEESRVPDVLLLGSSVTANATASMLAGSGSFLNLSVNGGTLVDAVGMLDVYERRGRWPRRVVLWLDGASFDPGQRDLRWRSLAAQIRRMSQRLGAPVAIPPGQGRLAELRQVLSWSYVGEAARAWLRGGDGLERVRILPASRAGRERVLRPDGSRSWGDFAPDRRAATRAAARAVAGGYVANLTRFAAAPGGLRESPRLRLLESLLAHLARRGVAVSVLTTPLAPGAVEALSGEEGAEALAALGELDRTLARVARAHGARFAGGSLPPTAAPCGGDGHLDLHHLRDACLARYLGAALEPTPQRVAHERVAR